MALAITVAIRVAICVSIDIANVSGYIVRLEFGIDVAEVIDNGVGNAIGNAIGNTFCIGNAFADTVTNAIAETVI